MVLDQPSIRIRHASWSPLGRISLAGFIRNGEGIPARPMRLLRSYALVYLVDGSGRFQDGHGVDQTVHAGDLMLLFPDVPHTYGPIPTTHWTELYLVFDGPLFDLWRRSGLLDPTRPVRHLEPIEHWTHRFESILDAPRQPGAAPPLLEIGRLQLVLSEALVHGQHTHAEGEDTAWAERARMLLESDLDQDLDLGQIATDLGMSYDGFRKRFRRVIGMAPARYRGTRIIDRAGELMHDRNLTDREIAERLGFCDEFYFSRRFKQITGHSPRQFRAHLPRPR